MRSFLLLSFLPVLIGLAGCAKEAPPAIPLQPPVASQQPTAPSPPPPMPSQQAMRAAPRPSEMPQQSLSEGAYFSETGLASFYGRAHDGNTTANGKSFDHRNFTAAHRTLPFGTLVRVTNLSNGRMVTVEVTDRGPHIKTRIIDISLAAARALHMQRKGVTRVKLEAFREELAGGG
jgi:rare lipoprotein A